MEKEPLDIIRKAPFVLRVEMKAEEALATSEKMKEGLKRAGRRLGLEIMDGDFLYKFTQEYFDFNLYERHYWSVIEGVLNGKVFQMMKIEEFNGDIKPNSKTCFSLNFCEKGDEGSAGKWCNVEVVKDACNDNLFEIYRPLQTEESYLKENYEYEKYEELSNLFGELEAVAMLKPSQDDMQEPF